MLELLQEDGVSLVQRADMIYGKKPKLENLVHEIYREYQSLAEQHDRLRGQIQNVPTSVQHEYGLSVDSLSITDHDGGPSTSLVRSESLKFESGLRATHGQIEHRGHVYAKRKDISKVASHIECSDNDMGSEIDEACEELYDKSSNKENLSIPEIDGKKLDSLQNLQKEIDELKEWNIALAESHEKTQNLNAALEITVKELQDCLEATQKEADILKDRLDELSAELVDKPIKAPNPPADEDGGGNEADKAAENGVNASERDLNRSLGSWGNHTQNGESLDQLQRQLDCLREENRKKELTLLEREEEKREAIRQLSFSIYTLKRDKKLLEEKIRSFKKKVSTQNSGTSRIRRALLPSSLAGLVQLFAANLKRHSVAL
ncbi:hypothetical protein KP509_39G034900 [Ceratopteris richardii]|nr:hypothetical protein KP509_39G034900 [Ceratopteris richardii]